MGSSNGVISAWDLDVNFANYALKAHDGEVMSIYWLPNELIMISGGTDKTFKIWRYPESWTGMKEHIVEETKEIEKDPNEIE